MLISCIVLSVRIRLTTAIERNLNIRPAISIGFLELWSFFLLIQFFGYFGEEPAQNLEIAARVQGRQNLHRGLSHLWLSWFGPTILFGLSLCPPCASQGIETLKTTLYQSRHAEGGASLADWNWSSTELESGNPLGAFLQTPAPALDKVSGPMRARFLSSTGLGFGTLIYKYIYIYICCKVKSGPIFALFKVKKWSIFLFFWGFYFSIISFSLQKEEEFWKTRQKTTTKKHNF